MNPKTNLPKEMCMYSFDLLSMYHTLYLGVVSLGESLFCIWFVQIVKANVFHMGCQINQMRLVGRPREPRDTQLKLFKFINPHQILEQSY